MQIVCATTNRGKVREFQAILKKYGIVLKALPAPLAKQMPPERGKSFIENAVAKARSVARMTGGWALADDSGLEIDALHGAPGIRSARFAGRGAGSRELCEKVLRLMRGVSLSKRGARFVCVLALARPDGQVRTFRGECRGHIAFEMRGAHGFGYDPIFIPRGFKKTFAELSPATKNRISHRGRAAQKLARFLMRHRRSGSKFEV